jgi:hypothetical protein
MLTFDSIRHRRYKPLFFEPRKKFSIGGIYHGEAQFPALFSGPAWYRRSGNSFGGTTVG